MNDEELNRAAELSFGPLEKEPTPALLDLLCDEEVVTRHAAATALQRRGERAAFERGVELTRNKRVYVRDNAAFLLGQLGYKEGYPFRDESVPVLEGLLNNDLSNEVRASAAAALGHLGATSALGSLLRAADHEDSEIRENVAFALTGMATPEIAPVIEKLRNDPDTDVADWAELAMEILYRYQYEDEAVDHLCTMFADADLDIAARKAVAEILTEHDETFAWEQANAFRISGVATLRLNVPLVSRCLGRSNETPPRAEVLRMLFDLLRDDPEARVRALAAEVLAEFEGAEVLDSLIAAAADPAWQVRHSVAFALSRHVAPEAEAPLSDLCSDPDECVARYARERLEWMNCISRNRKGEAQ